MSNPDRGEFPYPLTHGPEESRYLTWVRNHSSYMAVRGLLDYLRAAAVLVRGIILNFLIFLPVLLTMSVGLAVSHHWMLQHPFRLTLGAVAVGILWVLLFPLAMPLFSIVRYRRSLDTGSNSSVKQRDLYERTYGAAFLLVAAAAALEAVPWILEFSRDRMAPGAWNWQSAVATLAGMLSALSGADALLKSLRGVMRTVAMFVVGAIGVLVPLVVVLFATNFLLYGPTPSPYTMLTPVIVAGTLIVALVLAIMLGRTRRAFTRLESVAVTGFLAIGVAITLGLVVVTAAITVYNNEVNPYRVFAGVFRLTDQANAIPDNARVSPAAQAVITPLVTARKAFEQTNKIVEAEASRFDETENSSPLDELRRAQTYWSWERTLFLAARPLIELTGQLAALPDGDLASLRAALTTQTRASLAAELRAGGTPPEHAVLRALYLLHLVSALRETRSDDGVPPPCPKMDGATGDVRAICAWASAYDTPDRLATATTLLNGVLRSRLAGFAKPELAELIPPDALFDAVKKVFSGAPDTAERARLEGTAALASLLTTEQLLGMVQLAPDALRNLVGPGTLKWAQVAAALPEWVTPEGEPSTESLAAADRQYLSQLAGVIPEQPTETTDGTVWTHVDRACEHDVTACIGVTAAVEAARFALLRADYATLNHLATFPMGPVAPPPTVMDTLRSLFGLDLRIVAPPPQEPARTETLVSAIAALGTGRAGVWSGEFSRAVAEAALQRGGWDARPIDELGEAGQTPAPCVESGRTRDEQPGARRSPLCLALAVLAREEIFNRAVSPWQDPAMRHVSGAEAAEARNHFGAYAGRGFDVIGDGHCRKDDALADDEHCAILIANRFLGGDIQSAVDETLSALLIGPVGRLDRAGLTSLKAELTAALLPAKAVFLLILAGVVWLVCWMTVDVNLTSIHGLYRDRLASAFLVGRDTKGDIDIEDDLDLADMARYEAGSSAPYHLINVALNLQGSRDIGIRDRHSDFFIFSKQFTGGERTGYCRSQTMEDVFPEMSLGSAMAISAAAAAPNMGRSTSRALVAFMTLLNTRMGYWVPNPGKLEDYLNPARRRRERKAGTAPKTPGFTFEDVFSVELREICRRWREAYRHLPTSPRAVVPVDAPTVRHGLVGLGFSGGGIRSASINLGLAQVLNERGVFTHVDFLSTVSGGGYLGSSLSTLMRARERMTSEIAGTVGITHEAGSVIVTVTPERGEARTYRFGDEAVLRVQHGQKIAAGQPLLSGRPQQTRSEIAGTATVVDDAPVPTVRVADGDTVREYAFTRFDRLAVSTGDRVKAGQPLIRVRNSVGARFAWRIRPSAFLRELTSRLDERGPWVNLSDGGHIENLAGLELLRRRCKYVILGDGEADPAMHFEGLAILMRTASIDLGITIRIDVDALRLRANEKEPDGPHVSGAHFAVGTITYPARPGDKGPETGYLLYVKSSFTGDEGEVIRQYRHQHPEFPHEPTADQFFDEGQFEAYRSLGQHIGEGIFGTRTTPMSFAEFTTWIEREATRPVPTTIK